MAADDKSVGLAIWFHDSVYDSKTKDNEARSAERVGEWMRPLGVTDDFLEHVQAMILATAHTDSAKVDADTAVLLDADLAIFSATKVAMLAMPPTFVASIPGSIIPRMPPDDREFWKRSWLGHASIERNRCSNRPTRKRGRICELK